MSTTTEYARILDMMPKVDGMSRLRPAHGYIQMACAILGSGTMRVLVTDMERGSVLVELNIVDIMPRGSLTDAENGGIGMGIDTVGIGRTGSGRDLVYSYLALGKSTEVIGTMAMQWRGC